jgi:hypothetical protein
MPSGFFLGGILFVTSFIQLPAPNLLLPSFLKIPGAEETSLSEIHKLLPDDRFPRKARL